MKYLPVLIVSLAIVAPAVSPAQGDAAEQTARDALARAEQAHEKKQYLQALKQCDLALEALKKLPDDIPHKRLKAEALDLKGRAVNFPQGAGAALRYHEQALAIWEEIANKAEYASCLKSMGKNYESARDEEKSIAAYRQALELFEELGDKGQQAETLTWLGSKLLFKGNAEEAMGLFKKAMPLYTESETSKPMAGVCRAAIRLIEEVGEEPGLKALLGHATTYVTFKKDTESVTYAGETGSLRGGVKPWGICVFYFVGQMKPALVFTRKAGDTWSQDVFSYTFHPLLATATFESNSETVEVLAGGFPNCWKIKTVTAQTAVQAEDEHEQIMVRLNKIHCGTREMWYAPGVGLVKYRADQESGLKVTIELAKYSIQGDKESYFPLAVGNWWEYRPVDIPEHYVTKDRYEVFGRDGEEYYLSHYQYAYRQHPD